MPYPSTDTHPGPGTYPGIAGPSFGPGGASELKWALCDLDGNVLSYLTERLPGGSVVIERNGQRTAHLSVPVESDDGSLVSPFDTALKVWLNGDLIINGPVIAPRWASGSAIQAGNAGPLTVEAGRRHHFRHTRGPGPHVRRVGARGAVYEFEPESGGGGSSDTVDIAAVDPSCHLEETPLFAYKDGAGLDRQMVTITGDQSSIMSQLVQLHVTYVSQYGSSAGSGRSAGIAIGTLAPGSGVRTRNYSTGQNLWEAMTELAAVFDGIDFELEPLDGVVGTMAQLNTFYPRQGSDVSDAVRFEYNIGRHNVGAFAWEPGGGQITNLYAVSGKPNDTATIDGIVWDVAPMRTARHLGSIQQYGLYADYEAATDVTDVNTLADKAKKIVAARALPIDFIEITPTVERDNLVFGWARHDDGTLQPLGPQAYGSPPRFGPSGDYWIGDDVRVIARQKPGIDVNQRTRVQAATITEADESGAVVVELTCCPVDVAAADVDVLTHPEAYSVRQVLHGHKRHRHHHRHHHHRHPHHRHGKMSDR